MQSLVCENIILHFQLIFFMRSHLFRVCTTNYQTPCMSTTMLLIPTMVLEKRLADLKLRAIVMSSHCVSELQIWMMEHC